MGASCWLAGWLVAGLVGAEPDYATWDRLFLKPELPLRVVAPAGELTLLLYHTYPGSLQRVRIRCYSDSFSLTTEPAEVAELLPTTIVPITLRVRTLRTPIADTAELPLTLSAAEVARTHIYPLKVPLTERGAAELNDSYAVPAGQVTVVVTRMGRLTMVLQVLAIMLLLGWLLVRKRRVGP